MRGGTASNRDSGATDSALQTSRPGPQPQQSENPASSAAGGSGQQQDRRANPVDSTPGGSGMQRECEEPSPSTIGGNAGECVSLRSIGKKKNTNKGRGNIFKIPHLQRFGLKIECRDANSSAIQSVSSRFCFCFGREPQPGLAAAGKRKALQSVKPFSKPWRIDAYEQHLNLQNPTKWCEYGKASHAEQAFFDVAMDEVALISSLDAHVDAGAIFFWVREKTLLGVI
jgi:hypothetical protein